MSTSASTPPPVQLSKQVAKGITVSYASAIINGILHLAVLSIMAHMLSPTEFGLLGMALIFISFAERIGQIGVGPALVQKQLVSKHEFSMAASIGVLSGVLIYFLFWFISPYIADFFREQQLVQILRVLALVFVLEGLGMVSNSRLERDLRFKALLVVDNLSYFLGSGLLAVILAYYGFGVWSLVLGLVGNRFFKIILLNYIAPQGFTLQFAAKEAWQLLRFGAGFSLGRILNFSALYGDNFVVGRMLGTDPLGLYSRAYQLMTLPSTYFAQIIDRVLFPAFAKRQDNRDKLKHAFLTGIEAVALVSLPLSVFMYLASHEIVLVLFGKKWLEMVPVLSILSLGVFVRTAYKNGDTLTRALGAVYQHAIRQAIYTILVITGSLIGCRWGLEGVAYGVLFAVTANYVMMMALSIRLLNITYRELFSAHIPAVWVASCITLAILPCMPFISGLKALAVVKLAIASSVCIIASIIGILLAPRFCRAQSLIWFGQHFNFKKFGIFGKGVHFLIARQS